MTLHHDYRFNDALPVDHLASCPVRNEKIQVTLPPIKIKRAISGMEKWDIQVFQGTVVVVNDPCELHESGFSQLSSE